MDRYQFIVDYKKNDGLRNSFNELAMMTFGKAIDFESWYQNGYWNDCYVCYSFVDGERVIANASINHMTIRQNGQTLKAIQIGTVMTHPDYRRQGLAQQLLMRIIEDYESKVDYIYLFGNDMGLSLYKGCGFEPIVETKYTMSAASLVRKTSSSRKLNLAEEKDLNLLKEMSDVRTPVSKSFGVTNDEHLILFYCSKFMSETLAYLPGEEAIVSYEIDGKKLLVYDVISRHAFDLNKILEELVTSEVESIEFFFVPDIEERHLVKEPLVVEDQTLLVKPSITHMKTFRYPMFSHA